MSKKYDLIGETFGKLTVLSKAENPNQAKKKRTFWICECECGEQVITDTTTLLSNKKSQCWVCAHKATGLSRRIDRTGERFGRLVVQKMIYNNRSGNKQITKAECLCDCGNTVTRSIDSIKRTKTSSCGCAKKEVMKEACGTNIDGQKFGRLLVLETMWDESPVKVKCLCDCGTVGVYIKAQLPYGGTQSCGCLQKERASESNQKDWSGYVNGYGVKFIKKHSQNKRGVWVWECRCPNCDTVFLGIPAVINLGHKTSCGCKNKSSMENFIFTLLTKNSINFKEQFSIKGCSYKYCLKFDFAVFDNNKLLFLIEYDGQQHYKPVDHFGGEEGFVKTKTRDRIKDEFCKNNKLTLLRLPYFLTEEEIEQQILEILNDCGGSVAI